MTLSATAMLQATGLCGLLVAALTDIRTRIIPDGTVVWVLIMGLLARLADDGWSAGLSLLISFVLFVPLAALTHKGFIGGGDAKMIPAAATLVDPHHIVGLLLAIAVAGGTLAGLLLAASRTVRLLAGPRAAKATAPPTLPYGAAIFSGVAFTLVLEAPPCFATSCSP